MAEEHKKKNKEDERGHDHKKHHQHHEHHQHEHEHGHAHTHEPCNCAESKNNIKTLLVGLIAGAFLGALTGLLLASRSGHVSRRTISDYAQHALVSGEQKIESVMNLSTLVKRIKVLIREAEEAIQK